MAVTIQPQRIPLGTVMVGGRALPVTITVEWYRVLKALTGQVSTIVDGDGNSDDGGGSGAGGDAIDFANDEASAVKVLAIVLQRAVSALEADADVPALRAKLAQLETRIAGMEQTP